MLIEASWNIERDETNREFYYYVPLHNDKHLCKESPFFILFVHEINSEYKDPLVFVHTINRKLKFEELKEKCFYIFDASKTHGLFPKNEIDNPLNMRRFDKSLCKEYKEYKEVEHVLIANVFDWQHHNSFDTLKKKIGL